MAGWDSFLAPARTQVNRFLRRFGSIGDRYGKVATLSGGMVKQAKVEKPAASKKK